MLLGKKKKWSYIKPVIRENISDIHNIYRGWYQIYTFHAEQSYDWNDMIWSLNRDETISLVLINIGEYRDRVLDEHALQNINNILQFFSTNDKDIILRITYDTEGKGLEREPSSFGRIEEHIEQIGAILAEYADSIYIYQGMLVGNWGEMHGSKYLDDNRIINLYMAVNDNIPAGTFLAVRRPVYWRMLHTQEDYNNLVGRQDNNTDMIRTGLFNDAIMGSATDLGTYGTSSVRKIWSNAWLPKEELEFIDGLCSNVPCGGEVVADTGGLLSLEDAVSYLSKLHISYLNCRYDTTVLEHWKKIKWHSDDEWNGMNGYDYIGRHLGYRYCIRDVDDSISVKNNECTVTVHIENTGFAEYVKPVMMLITLVYPDGNKKIIKLSYDIRKIRSKTIAGIRFSIPLMEEKIYIKLVNESDEREILFANDNISPHGIMIGELVMR